MAKKTNMRLRYLRVNPQSTKAAKPCTNEIQSLLACWRLSGVDSSSCLGFVSALATCSSAAAVSARAETHQLGTSINFMLNKMFKARNL